MSVRPFPERVNRGRHDLSWMWVLTSNRQEPRKSGKEKGTSPFMQAFYLSAFWPLCKMCSVTQSHTHHHEGLNPLKPWAPNNAFSSKLSAQEFFFYSIIELADILKPMKLQRRLCHSKVIKSPGGLMGGSATWNSGCYPVREKWYFECLLSSAVLHLFLFTPFLRQKTLHSTSRIWFVTACDPESTSLLTGAL